MENDKEMMFKNVSLKIVKPTENVIDDIYDAFAHSRFDSKDGLEDNLKGALVAYKEGVYNQYIININERPIGFLKIEKIKTKRGTYLNDGTKFNEDIVFKMSLIIDDKSIKENVVSDIIFCLMSHSNFRKAVIFATQISDRRFIKALKNNLFKDIVDCKYNAIVKNSDNNSDCKFYFFKTNQDNFFINNEYANKNRRKIG